MFKLLLLFLLPFTIDAALPKTNAPQSTRFADFDKGYSIQFPQSWRVQRDFMGLDAFAAGPDNNPEQRSEANISIAAELLGSGVNLEEFFNNNMAALAKGLNAFKIVETGKTALNGIYGKMAIYTHTTQDNLKLRVQQYFFVQNQAGIILTCSCVANQFDVYTPIFAETAKTFQLY